MLDKTQKDETIINNNTKQINVNVEIILVIVALVTLYALVRYLKQYINKKVRSNTIRNEINA